MLGAAGALADLLVWLICLYMALLGQIFTCKVLKDGLTI